MRRPDDTRKTNEVTFTHDRGAMRLITVLALRKMTRFGAIVQPSTRYFVYKTMVFYKTKLAMSCEQRGALKSGRNDACWHGFR
jgi:hypothetical protein